MQSEIYQLGFLTLGQAPRSDVIPSFMDILGEQLTYGEAGALDNLDEKQIRELYPSETETTIETRLSSGSKILVSRERLLPLLMEKATDLQQSCRHVILLCSGSFPTIKATINNLVEPITLIRGVVRILAEGKTLGIVGPESDLEEAPAQWADYAARVVCSAASPYGVLEQIGQAAKDAATKGADIILLDDMGFTEEHRTYARKHSNISVICATTLTAKILSELI